MCIYIYICIHIIFLLIYISNFYEILSFYPPLCSFSLAWLRFSKFFFSSLVLLFFFSFSQSFSHRHSGHENLRVSRDSFVIGLISSRILLLFFFSFHYPLLLTYPYPCDSQWSIIVIASRMISRRRSASSPLSSPRISRWRIHSDDYKDRYPFPFPRPLSLTIFHFPFSVLSPFLCFTHFESISKAHVQCELQISLARHGRAVFTPLLSSYRRRRCRRFSFYSFTFFSFLLKFWTELSESVQAAVSVQIYRTKRKRVEYLERIQRRKNDRDSIDIHHIPFYSLMRNNYIHLNPN